MVILLSKKIHSKRRRYGGITDSYTSGIPRLLLIKKIVSTKIGSDVSLTCKAASHIQIMLGKRISTSRSSRLLATDCRLL